MNDDRRDSDHDWCPPPTSNPADQPKPGDCLCEPLPKWEAPKLPPDEQCPPPDPCCKCPPPPCAEPPCLVGAIDKQAATSAAAADSEKFKKDLEALQKAAAEGKKEYTRDNYDKLVKRWVELDGDIESLIRKVVCTVKCWRCIIECYVCPMINELHHAEKRLLDDGQLYSDVHNLYDLQYWHQRNRDAKSRRLERIKTVLRAWEKPYQTIDNTLKANKDLYDAAMKAIGTEPGKVIYDVFMKLVPMHLAIAPPPQGPKWKTKIDMQYTNFCPCDKGTPDDCCGPDVGELSIRRRLTPVLPFLIDPHKYFDLICCLVDKRYVPAHEDLVRADLELAGVTSQIERNNKQLTSGITDFESVARGAIPSLIDCCEFDPHGRKPHEDQSC